MSGRNLLSSHCFARLAFGLRHSPFPKLCILLATVVTGASLPAATSARAQPPFWWDPVFPHPGFYPGPVLPPPVYPAPFPVPVPVPVPVPPQSVQIDSDLTPDPPLAPASVDFVNSSRDPLRIEVIDRKQRQTITVEDIPSGGSITLTLRRDIGGTEVATYRTYGPAGDYSDRKITRRVEPQIRYEVAVHRWKIQSIAIDRTGKSPDPIEDVNFAGQPLGRFVLPAGGKLVDGRIDVYRTAIDAANPGTVAPIYPAEKDLEERDPLRDVFESLSR